MTSKRPSYMAERRIVAERLDCSLPTAYLWLISDSNTHKRRVAAALSADRTDFTQPTEGMADWLAINHGVSATDVAQWYGYHKSSFYGWTGQGRFLGKRPHRAWTLVDHYLKEHSNVESE